MLSFNNDGVLPKGIHEVDLSGFKELFGFNYKRQDMIDQGLIPFLKELEPFNVQKIYLDGSFVTQKENPDDIDGYAVTTTTSTLSGFIAHNSERWREKYRMDFYLAFSDIPGYSSEEYWQEFFSNTSSDVPKKKGLIALNIVGRG